MEMAKAYDPKSVEQRVYAMWEEGGNFKPRPDPDKKPFTIVMPPPNVTGELHTGHAMMTTIEDLLVRWHRMKGDPTLFLPGVDHAGIATQNVVERELGKQGKTRHGVGREKFVETVWDWVRKYRHIISDQQRRLGASCDWDRETFTLDPQVVKAVRTTFYNLYQEGLIYRGERLINWCPRCQTALSDLEVDHQEVHGHLWYLRYPLLKEDSRESGGVAEIEPGQYVVVATTRPETMVADVAVAIAPDSERWRHLLGRTVLLPIVNRPVPVIEDAAIETGFGTGALKVTPGHDPVDFEIAQRHDLPILNGMEPDGSLGEIAGMYAWIDRFEARDAIVKHLEEEGLVDKVEDYTTSIGHCDRCGTIVEPLVSTQWFMKMDSLAAEAIKAVRRSRIKIVPDRFYSVFFNWMENIRDWCISRQLWWGHRIPVWYCADGHQFAAIEDPKSCAECGSSDLEQDPDVLDTWFSSQLWPHVTLGWPDETDDLRRFYPNSVMETGYDILFFWVARMIMIGLKNMDEVPFETIYLHGIVRDSAGQKMGKSKGNVVNPLDLIDKYGTDALRFFLATAGAAGNDMRLSNDKLQGARNFANKVWNIARFVLSQPVRDAEGELDYSTLALEDRWILTVANRVAEEVDYLLRDWQINEAGQRIRDFIWSDFADWYVEMSKVRIRQGDFTPMPVLLLVLNTSLKLLHPFMPFVTEEIWQSGKSRIAQTAADKDIAPLIVAAWPQLDKAMIDEEAEHLVKHAIDAIRAIRLLRVENRVEAGKWVEAYIVPLASKEWIAQTSRLVGRQLDVHGAFAKLAPTIEQLGRVRPLHLIRGDNYPREQVARMVFQFWYPLPEDQSTTDYRRDRMPITALGGSYVVIPVGGLFDIEAERERVQKQVLETEDELSRLKSRLGDANFRVKAPKEIVAREEARLAAVQSRLEGLRQQLDQLES
jgi:valyl-tRNA synthetase